MASAFRHVESDRTLLFGRGALADAGALLGDGYTLLSTPRAAAAAPAVAAAAARTIEVPAGKVDAVAADLLEAGADLGPPGTLLVALGGGRVIDVAKALAAAAALPSQPDAGAAGVSAPSGRESGALERAAPRTVAAIPTTLSGAEMTGGHRHARGIPADTPRVRPALVVNDPALSASHAVPELAASSANALGHVLVAIASTQATPFSAAVARESAQRFATAWGGADPDRDEIALGALLAGWAVDQSGLGLQHVLAQTAVRTAGIGHAEANAALLPESVAAVRRRRPELLAALDAQLAIGLEPLAQLLRATTDGDGLAPLARDEALLEQVVIAVTRRTGELARIPPPPDADELRAIYRTAAAA